MNESHLLDVLRVNIWMLRLAVFKIGMHFLLDGATNGCHLSNKMRLKSDVRNKKSMQIFTLFKFSFKRIVSLNFIGTVKYTFVHYSHKISQKV